MYQPIEPIIFTKSDVDGFPSVISEFKAYLRHENHEIVKITLSIFRSCEIFRLPPNHDISTVVRQPNYDEKIVMDIIHYIPLFVKKLSRLQFKPMIYHYTTKNGPNGPALASSNMDLCAVRNDVDIYNALRTVSTKLNDMDFPDENYQVTIPGIHSRLTQFSEKAGKTRTIAVVDYYSQRALYPLHKSLMDLLRGLSSDGTFSHMNVGKYAQEATRDKTFIATSDMTAFTDLFPAIIQHKLLLELVEDPELAESWWTLLAKRNFTVAWSGESVSYGTGQPMGAYASWPLCTLAHHLIMHYCAYKKSIKNPNKFYRILGDDNERTNKVLSIFYEETLLNLGCELNPYKGTVSRPGIKYSSAEVAKRLYLNGLDISPLTPGLINSLGNPALINNALRDIKQMFNKPELPVHILDNVVRKEKRDKCWMLCTNPYNGIIKPGNPGYDDHSDIWASHLDRDDLYEILNVFRINNLIDKAIEVDHESDLVFDWVGLQTLPRSNSIPDGGDMELKSAPQYAQHFCRKRMFIQLSRAINKLWYNEIENYDPFILEEVEYMADPRNPFMDSKDLRSTLATLLVEKSYDFLEAGSDVKDLKIGRAHV